MASGKKGKKTKGKTLALTDFLQETTGSISVQPIRKSNLNWADEVEDYDDVRKPVNVVLPTAPKASRDYDDISDKVPTEPPFCAYLSNLPYDVDEEEITAFFSNMRVANMRIPKDDRGGESKSKGYGYIEFEDRESLLDALVMRDTTLKSRRMRIEVASNMENDRRRGGRMDMNRDRQTDRSDSFPDWRSGPRTSEMDDRRSGYNRDRDGGGGGFTREGMRDRDDKSFTREGMRDRESNRDYGRDRESNRDSYRRDNDDRSGGWRDGDRQNNDRGLNRDRAMYRDTDRGSGGRYDDRDERRGYGGRRFDDRDKGFTRRDDRDSELQSSEPRERPKLVLTPRTKPVENVPVNKETVPSASIFGSAKPVDTSQREREIEEKLAREADKPRENSKDREKEKKLEDTERKNIDKERNIAPRKVEDSPHRERNTKDGPPMKNFDDRKLPNRNDQRSPDKSENKHKQDKADKPKWEEKRERHDKEMPKLTEPEPPNFTANNKFAYLPTDSD
ncbi:eukaryotic translation initiation factor 4B-like [Diorhabda sublineata]|uniref:eukaryotic translation initiation factor 4B-like n=1 Tax=Diorhabda sublineata TaxID=1163346 RepID=UPI0024E13CB2|nr:eukaryotic translation initiation factor 4B-like [Diorhabda sublineata]